jgi:hypothetical protein
MASLDRPIPGEYAPLYERYVALVPPGDVLMVLREQHDMFLHELGALSDAQSQYRYAPGKWSVKEVVGHLADTERVFAYRALCFARAETQPLPGFDEEAYVVAARFGTRPFAALLEEYRVVRNATLALFATFNSEALARRGTANDREVSVRAMAAIIAGHEAHHWRLFRDRYLPGIKK